MALAGGRCTVLAHRIHRLNLCSLKLRTLDPFINLLTEFKQNSEIHFQNQETILELHSGHLSALDTCVMRPLKPIKDCLQYQ